MNSRAEYVGCAHEKSSLPMSNSFSCNWFELFVECDGWNLKKQAHLYSQILEVASELDIYMYDDVVAADSLQTRRF